MEMFLPIEKTLPLFFGALVALVLSALLSVNAPAPVGYYAAATKDSIAEKTFLEESALFFGEAQEEKNDLIETMYREFDMQERVIDFFAGVCGSREIAKVILDEARTNDIPPALAFALAWEESRFNSGAVNTKNRDGSIDRGLFQLNNRSFPDMDTKAFFDPAVNAKNGMSHLRHCLNTGGTEIAALAMYNAGTGRVGSTGAPKSTLDYIHRILRNREKIEARFETQVRREEEKWTADSAPLLTNGAKLRPCLHGHN